MDRLVGTDWLEKQLGSPDLRVVDCTVTLESLPEGGVEIGSGRAAWEQGHIPGSQHVDLLQELSDPGAGLPFMLPSPERFSAALGAAGIGDSARVVLYDAQMNMWAARVWWMLRAYGFDRAAVLDGGWRAWSHEGRPVSSGVQPHPPEALFVAQPRPGLFVGKDAVLAALDRSDVAVVDALESEVYRGDRQEYARAGHIPGAYNVPFAEVVDPATHRYLPPERLRDAFADVLSTAPGQVITYCGAAIAASSAAFALGLIGYDGVAIYDGSMIEWSADPGLPLATGD